MTRLWNEPANFTDEMIDGFVAANPQIVRRVVGGVVRSTASPKGEVAVVIGGGSGHYPAFGGLVGAGLAHGAAMGNVFASPSVQQIVSVAKASHKGGGVLLSYGNYAGDVLNFDAAQEQLRAAGIQCETVVVTDDVASASVEEAEKRRGIAGDLGVFRIVASAAERGLPLSEVQRLGKLANDRTRTFGVAFSGCTLPGAAVPLFEVPSETMAIGLGIHGEPGIQDAALPSADDLAELLTAKLLSERPLEDNSRVVPILNGLGSVKYEEMFVVFRKVNELLSDLGVEIIDPHVGEYCTSFDMAGLSLTFVWLNDELDKYWEHDVYSASYRRGSVGNQVLENTNSEEVLTEEYVQGDHDSQEIAATVFECVNKISQTIDTHVEELGRLDSIAGDGDHGIGMQRGAHAALETAKTALQAGAGAQAVLAAAANSWSDKAGGTSGVLWGVILNAVAEQLGNTGRPSALNIAQGVHNGCDRVMQFGKAELGDKTLVDALFPFAQALLAATEDGQSLYQAWSTAAEIATSAASKTAEMVPQRGRARTHSTKSLGIPDPGAHSFALIVTALGEILHNS